MMTVVDGAAAAVVLLASLLHPAPVHPVVHQEPKAVVSHAKPAGRGTHGTATWYCGSRCTRGYPGGLYAAAGSELRVGDWRGRRVTVTASNGRSVVVTLVDWCACKGERIIDLYGDAFARLAPLSRGVLRVTVSG